MQGYGSLTGVRHGDGDALHAKRQFAVLGNLPQLKKPQCRRRHAQASRRPLRSAFTPPHHPPLASPPAVSDGKVSLQ